MRNWEKIKEAVSKELKSTINTIDPAFDLDSCLDLYEKIISYKIKIPTKNDLNGLEETIISSLNEFFIEGKISNKTTGDFCKNFEQFLKKLYYIFEECNIIEKENFLNPDKLSALGPYISALNKVKPIFLDKNKKEVYDIEFAELINKVPNYKINPETNQKTFLKLIPNSVSVETNGVYKKEKFTLDDYDNIDNIDLNNKFKNTFLLYFIKAVILKNEQSHQAPDRNKLSCVSNLNTTLVAKLWVINFFNKELSKAIKKSNSSNKDHTEYINSILQKVKKQSSKFVSLILTELKNNSTEVKTVFIEDLIDRGITRFRILGQGGSGKTTTLEYLLYKDCKEWLENRNNSKIPVLITLGNLKSNETIIENIAKKLNCEVEYIEELLETNELTIYLDGLNEIVESREAKKQKLLEIGSILLDYPNLSMIITDRYDFDSYQNNMFDIPTFQIQKLNTEQIQEFVLKYCHDSVEQSKHVLNILKDKINIQEILLRPLVLTRAIEIIKIENDLPEHEGQIIEKFIDILLKREKDEKKDPLLNVNNFKLLLSYAANEIWHKYKSNTAVHAFTFNKMLVEASEKFGLERFNAGYVSRIGYELEILSRSEDLIQFYHQSYLEFFCKHYLKYQYQ